MSQVLDRHHTGYRGRVRRRRRPGAAEEDGRGATRVIANVVLGITALIGVVIAAVAFAL